MPISKHTDTLFPYPTLFLAMRSYPFSMATVFVENRTFPEITARLPGGSLSRRPAFPSMILGLEGFAFGRRGFQYQILRSRLPRCSECTRRGADRKSTRLNSSH